MIKRCSRCKEYKEFSLFYKETRAKDSHRAECKDCSKKLKEKYLKSKEYKESRYFYNLERKYNVNKQQYLQLLKDQNHKCKVCGIEEVDVKGSKLFVDHCHNSGKVRGLLCFNCNLALGHVFDSVEVLENMIKYLKQEG